MIKELRQHYPNANVIAVDYDPGASEVNQLNRIKLMLATAHKNLKAKQNSSAAPAQFSDYSDAACPDGADGKKKEEMEHCG